MCIYAQFKHFTLFTSCFHSVFFLWMGNWLKFWCWNFQLGTSKDVVRCFSKKSKLKHYRNSHFKRKTFDVRQFISFFFAFSSCFGWFLWNRMREKKGNLLFPSIDCQIFGWLNIKLVLHSVSTPIENAVLCYHSIASRYHNPYKI